MIVLSLKMRKNVSEAARLLKAYLSSVCLLVLLPSLCQATGPSYARIVIVPLAANDHGVVVFKTERHVNKMGSASLEGTEYGWLCVSSSGVWEERIHLTFTNGQTSLREVERFLNRTDLSNPPPSLQSLMEACDVVSWVSLDPSEGRGRARWQPERLCVDHLCSNGPIPQRSLAGFRSSDGAGSSVESRFFYAGVAVFDNLEHDQSGEPVQIGARFYIENLYYGKDIGIDILGIAAIAIFELPPDKRKWRSRTSPGGRRYGTVTL